MQENTLSNLLLAGLAGTLLLGSCGLIGNEETQTDSTYFRATLNGEETWSTKQVEANLYNHAGFEWISVFGQNPRGRYIESLSVSIIFEGTGTYPLTEEKYKGDFVTRRTGSRFSVSDQDVLLTTYSPLDDTTANQLTITSYDSTTGVMEGTFRTTVVVDSADRESEPGEPPRRRPDTLRFTDGEFRVKVEDQGDQ